MGEEAAVQRGRCPDDIVVEPASEQRTHPRGVGGHAKCVLVEHCARVDAKGALTGEHGSRHALDLASGGDAIVRQGVTITIAGAVVGLAVAGLLVRVLKAVTRSI